MPRTHRSISTPLLTSLCLTLAYALIITLCAPFIARKVEATARAANRTSAAKPASSANNSGHRDGELIVRFRMGLGEQEKTNITENKGAHRGKPLRGESGIEKLTLPAGQDAESTAAQLRATPNIEFVEPNYLVQKDDTTPNDPSFSQQWALHNSLTAGADINVMPAWDTTTGSSSTVIAVIDSGIDFTHPDLTSNEWTNAGETAGNNRDDEHDGFIDDAHGWDYVADSPTIKDEQGHGTAIAGIIASEGNNATGTSGVMWHAQLMSLRVLDNTGTGDVAQAVEAIDYAVAHGATVINLSWGTDAKSLALRDAIDRAGRRGVVVVCSAGNDGRDLESTPYYPASYALPNMVSVAAIDPADRLASWSNYGQSHVTIAAPGVDILTTKMNGGYWTVSGTSASAPLVTGVVGLIKTVRPGLNAFSIVQAITSGGRPSASLTGRVSSGAVINAQGALAALSNTSGSGGGGNSGNGGGNGNNGNGGGNNGSGADNGNGQGHPPVPPVAHEHGSGGKGPNGSFDVTPPPRTQGAPGKGLPNLDQARKLKSHVPKASAPISSNLPCADCDPLDGGGGGYYYPANDPVFGTARALPRNQTGQPGTDLGSRNFNWSVPLLGLKGRAGLDLSLALFYNSLVWTKDGSYIKFDADGGSPSAGFHLGLPTLQARFYDSQSGIWSFMMVTSSGGRVQMRQVNGSNIYESQDGSYTQLTDNGGGNAVVRTTDGTQLVFSPSVNGESRCTQIKDRNGNYISAAYDGYGHIQTLTDTLNRIVTFNYDGDQNLISITQPWAGVQHPAWATFSYTPIYVAPSFSGLYVNGANNNYVTVLTQVTLADGSYYTFNYTSFGQINRINHYAADAHLLAYTSYNMDTSAWQTDCPRFTERRDWAESWLNGAEAVTSYSVDPNGAWSQETAPDGTRHKETFATAGWQTGLTTMTEEFDAAGVRQKWTTTDWTQDNIYASYQINPRPSDVSIYDAAGNRRRTSIDYGPYAAYSLPYIVHEYAADGNTILRDTYIDYNLDQTYINQHIIGLVSARHLVDSSGYQAKTVYYYDAGGEHLVATSAPSSQHDANYNTSYVAGRGLVTAVARFDVGDINNMTKATITRIGYDTNGSTIFTRDPLGHQTNISYTDSWSDGQNHNTFAYPTVVTDPDGYPAWAQYNYDMGVVTWRQDQKYAQQTTSYDAVGRVSQVTNLVNNAYKRWVYPASLGYVQIWETVQEGAGEAYSAKYFDGAGRVRATSGYLPGSGGGYLGQYITYNEMGRVSQQSNPAEITGGFVPTGDDAAGWALTLQSYDWKGRPTLTTNPDGSTTEATYGGCGCAGGEVTTTRDERGRRKKFTKDALGRLAQVEELNWDGTSVYSTTTYAYNARDQLTQLNKGGQVRSMEYDGHGRLWHRTTPEQGTSTYSYNPNDTVQTITDARTATQTFSYNNRDLMTGISYGAAGTAVATPSVSFDYDQAGNRNSMTDGQGSVTYTYDTLSQLKTETRYFSGLGASYTMSYDYNLAGELKSVTNHWGATVGYTHDVQGRVNAVTGSGYLGVSSYITSLGYRASGAAKQVSYGNGKQLSVSYDTRLRPTTWNVAGVLGSNYFYDDFLEKSGRVTYAQSLVDATLDREYDYDHVGRLVEAHTGAEARAARQGGGAPADGPYSQSYRYDEWGNMWYRVGWGGFYSPYTDASYSFQNNRLVTNPANGATMQYDAMGNLTNDGREYFQYDAVGKQTYASGSALSQSYDGDGLRVKKVENGYPTYYLRSSVLGGQVIAEINSGGGWARGYVYLGGQLLAIQDGAVIFVHQDPITKSQRLTDTAGNVVSGIELDPWGGETNRSWNQGRQPHKFTSYERDGNGSDDAQARRYHGYWNRFAQPDPFDGSYNLADPQSFNRYAYVNNDPVNFVDPSGLDGCLSGSVNGQCLDVRPSSVNVSGSFLPAYFSGGGRHVGRMLLPLDPSGDGGSRGRRIPDKPPQTRQTPRPTPQPCNNQITGDADVDALAQVLFGESTTADADEYNAIGQVFLNRYNANISWFGGQQWGRAGGVLFTGSTADDGGGNVPFRQAANNDSIRGMNAEQCAGFGRAQAAAGHILRTNPNRFSHPAGFIFGISGPDVLWFRHNARTQGGTRIGAATVFNFDPRNNATGVDVLNGVYGGRPRR